LTWVGERRNGMEKERPTEVADRDYDVPPGCEMVIGGSKTKNSRGTRQKRDGNPS
jgi:hypothetical protein